MPAKPVLVILGPTCSGKSSLAVAVARRCGGEIISADSRQIYRGLDIGTAKPDLAMLAAVRHHFIDEKNIGEEFSAGEFALEAMQRIRSIHASGRPAIVAGGSTLYLEGLLGGFSILPPSDPSIRTRLTGELQQMGAEKLYERLQTIDPRQAETLDPSKTQRLLRSLEIIEISGTTVTALQRAARQENTEVNFVTIGLSRPREALYERINQRTGEMMNAGFTDEVRFLYEQYRKEVTAGKINALRTVGYKELFQYFDGEITLEEAVMLIRQHTRNYAKRQLTFFKNRLNVQWVDAPDGEDEEAALVERLIQLLLSPF